MVVIEFEDFPHMNPIFVRVILETDGWIVFKELEYSLWSYHTYYVMEYYGSLYHLQPLSVDDVIHDYIDEDRFQEELEKIL